MKQIFLAYIIAINIFTFIIYAVDKLKAKLDKWRVPEKVLLMSSLLGGFLGGLSAMKAFHHKTKHAYFWVVNYVALVLWAFVMWKIYA